MPADFYSGPADAQAYANLPSQLDGVRVEPPRACDPRTLEYPHELPGQPAGDRGRRSAGAPRL
jgi:hypothetical protein